MPFNKEKFSQQRMRTKRFSNFMHGNCHCNEGLVDCDFEALPYL
jgi:hypothetical protein